jgi:hypothetical protein
VALTPAAPRPGGHAFAAGPATCAVVAGRPQEQASERHDALEFPKGKIILLARLCEGQRATVPQLPASPRATNEAEQQKSDSLVS